MSRRRFTKKRGGNKAPTSTKNNSRVNTKESVTLSDVQKSLEGDGKDGSDKSVKDIAIKTNDPAWYMYSPEQVSAVARIPFSEAFGDILPTVPAALYLHDAENGVVTKSNYTAVPGIAVIRTRPTFGMNFAITDPLNVCATELYTHVRYTNNGRKNYDAPDLMIHTLAIADVYSYIMWMKKIYGLAFIYSTRNKYIGKALLRACGVDPDAILSNLANLRYWLNTFINKVSAYVVPASINLFKRRAFLYSDVYTESETNNIKDQLYTFIPDGFMKYALDEHGAGMLTYLEVQTSVLSMDNLIDIGNSLLENITQDEDFGLMSGDLLKAFGSDIIKVDPLLEDYIIEPHYDHDVLSQIENGVLMRYFTGAFHPIDQAYEFGHWLPEDDPTVDPPEYEYYYHNGGIYQTPHGVLIHALCIPQTVTTPSANVKDLLLNASRNVLLNTDLPQVDESNVMEMTRLSSSMVNAPADWYLKSGSSGGVPMYVASCGSDVITGIYIYINDINANCQLPGSQLSVYALPAATLIYHTDGTIEGDAHLLEAKLINQFKYLPAVFEVDKDDAANYKYTYIWKNLGNYTFVDKTQLQRIHEVAMLSLVHVPGVSRNLIS